MSIVGKTVVWKHLGPDGKPNVDISGEVVAEHCISSATFRLLVLNANGEMRAADHTDVRVLGSVPVTVDVSASFAAIAAKIEELGLSPAIEGMFPSDAVCHLLDQLMKELAESEAKVAALSEKKKPGRPKKEDGGGSPA